MATSIPITGSLLDFARRAWDLVYDSTAGAIKTTSQAIVNGNVIVNPNRGTSAPEVIGSIGATFVSLDISNTEFVTVRSNSDGIGFAIVVGLSADDPAAKFASGDYYPLAPATFDGGGLLTSFEEKPFPTDGQDTMWFKADTGTGKSVVVNKVLSP